jgi:NTP pyrophosphatase (non-canonical NTP hydrolase)
MSLTFKKLNEINTNRCETSFHKIDEWSPTDWGCSAAGEMGEACNKITKLRRQSMPGYPLTSDQIDIKIDIGYEIADVVIYLDLLCSRLGLKLEDLVKEKFNITSNNIGSNFKL